MNLRPGLLVFACSCMAEAGSGDDGLGADSLSKAAPVRFVAGNLTSGNFQAYDDPGIRIFRGLHPDVAMIQEFNVGSDSADDLRTFVDHAFGSDYDFVRGAPAQIPNGIVSRYPIVDSGEWQDTTVANRDFVWARLDVPGAKDVVAISVHLLSSSSTSRQLEAEQLVQHIHGITDTYVVLGGDFNTGSRGETTVTTLSQVLDTKGPYPADASGNANTNSARAKPYDWVLADPTLSARAVPVVVGNASFRDGLVVDTRVFTPIGQLAPALASDSAATNMQHMAVVRDFRLQGAVQ